ncbi:hypothetical protein BC628DRAFT_1350483 [Trametes gibbosa]|nr:hypothetical protein BC628DRAFT_1350483 [Trametes gibbosa]
MPPRKKQRTAASPHPPRATTDQTLPPARRTTRAAARAAKSPLNAVPTTPPAKPPTRQTSLRPTTNAAVKRVLRVKGRLQSLPDLPIEIQLMIYNHLESRDLHHLSRTCKKFRAFFLNREQVTEKLWECARLNAGNLPERPPFMSEPAFIHLLYAANCHYCGTHGVRKIVHGYFLRLCASCYKEGTMPRKDAAEQFHKLSFSLASYCETIHRLAGNHVDRSLIPLLDGKNTTYGKIDFLVLKKPTQEIITKLKARQPLTSHAVKELTRPIVEEHELRRKHAESIRIWFEGQENKRLSQLKDARQNRFKAILKRLEDIGWGPELDFLGDDGLDNMALMPVVRQSTKLTQGSWLKVLSSLDQFLNDTRTKRLDTELRTALRLRFDALESALVAHYVKLPRDARMDCRPTYIDLAFRPECRAIIDVPTSQTVTVADFAKVVPTMVKKWETELKEQLTAYIRPHLGDIAQGVDPLTLAIAVFRCCSADSVMHWPYLLAHECSYGDCIRKYDAQPEDFKEDDVYTYTTKALNWQPPDNADYLRDLTPDLRESHDVPFRMDGLRRPEHALHAVDIMRTIVSASGLDPASATVEDLEQSDVWLRCEVCEERFPAHHTFAMSWKGAFSHHEDYGDSDARHKWYRASEDDMVFIRASREPKPAYQQSCYRTLLCCSLCPSFNAEASEGPNSMRAHLKKIHDIHDAEQAMHDGICYWHPRTHTNVWPGISVEVPKRNAEPAKAAPSA